MHLRRLQQPLVTPVSPLGAAAALLPAGLASDGGATDDSSSGQLEEQSTTQVDYAEQETVGVPVTGMPAAADGQLQPEQTQPAAQPQPTAGEGEVGSPLPADQGPPMTGVTDDDSEAAAADSLYITPSASLEHSVSVNIDRPLLRIPQSFLGISHEWTHVDALNSLGYKDMLRMLTSYGSGPISIRIGGASTDHHAYVFPRSVYDALRAVHEETGARYILSVNFEANNVTLSSAQLAIARATLPGTAIESVEIGNEVRQRGIVDAAAL